MSLGLRDIVFKFVSAGLLLDHNFDSLAHRDGRDLTLHGAVVALHLAGRVHAALHADLLWASRLRDMGAHDGL